MGPAFSRILVTLALVSSAAETRPQTYFYGVEPNNTKLEATPAFGVQSGDFLVASGFQIPPQPGIFRLRHAAAPLGIYRHELRPTPTFSLNWTSLTVLGRDAVQEFIYPQSLAIAQEAGPFGAPDAFLAWYGFGKSEELFVDLVATTSQRVIPFVPMRLTTLPVVEVDLGVVSGPSLWFTADGVGSVRDLELHLFDAEYNALPRGANDNRYSHTPAPRLNFNVAPGVYHIAVSDHASASHLPAAPDDLRYATTVLDFAGPFINDDPNTSYDVEVAIRSSQFGPLLASSVATKTFAYEVLWFRVQVDSGQATASFCPGDGTGGACACYGAAPLNSGMGCVNSTARGATAIVTDHSLSTGLRPWRITLEDLPPSTLALGFLGLQPSAATPNLAGLSCIGPGAVRVGPWQADLVGTAAFDGYHPTSSGFLVGQTVYMQAAYRDFFAPGGCQLNFTSGFSFVVR